jgi:hypothetical protein
MVEETFIKVYEVDLDFFCLHILIVVFPCRFKDFYIICRLRKEGVSRLKIIVDKVEYITMYSNFFTYYEQDMAKSERKGNFV